MYNVKITVSCGHNTNVSRETFKRTIELNPHIRMNPNSPSLCVEDLCGLTFTASTGNQIGEDDSLVCPKCGGAAERV